MGDDFSWALSMLREGRAVYRNGWDGQGQWLALQPREDKSKMTLSYIYISTVVGDLVPWVASQTDLLATDWAVIDNG